METSDTTHPLVVFGCLTEISELSPVYNQHVCVGVGVCVCLCVRERLYHISALWGHLKTALVFLIKSWLSFCVLSLFPPRWERVLHWLTDICKGSLCCVRRHWDRHVWEVTPTQTYIPLNITLSNDLRLQRSPLYQCQSGARTHRDVTASLKADVCLHRPHAFCMSAEELQLLAEVTSSSPQFHNFAQTFPSICFPDITFTILLFTTTICDVMIYSGVVK